MKKMILPLLVAFSFLTTAYADTETASIAAARAAELSSHRIERLVNLKKIDAAFISKLQTIELQKLSKNEVSDPTFLATVSQYAGTDGTKNQVELFLDDQGKTLRFNVKSGATAANAPVWTEKDPSSLVENGLHFVIDNGETNATLKPFYTGFLSLTLSKGTKGGSDVAVVRMTSKETQSVLYVYLKLDGTFLSHEIK